MGKIVRKLFKGLVKTDLKCGFHPKNLNSNLATPTIRRLPQGGLFLFPIIQSILVSDKILKAFLNFRTCKQLQQVGI